MRGEGTGCHTHSLIDMILLDSDHNIDMVLLDSDHHCCVNSCHSYACISGCAHVHPSDTQLHLSLAPCRLLQAAVQANLPEKMAGLYIEEGPGCDSYSVIAASKGVRFTKVWASGLCWRSASVLQAS